MIVLGWQQARASVKHFAFLKLVFVGLGLFITLPLVAAVSENNLIRDADELDKGLVHSGSFYNEPSLDHYLQAVTKRIFPQDAKRFRLRVIKGTQTNAFALPNGSLYFTTGLLANLENETQLAVVIAHEGMHFILKHALKERLKIEKTFSAKAISAYSHSLELEADREAFTRLKNANYNLKQVAGVFHKFKNDWGKAIGQYDDKFRERMNIYEGWGQQATLTSIPLSREDLFVSATKNVRAYYFKSFYESDKCEQLERNVNERHASNKATSESWHYLGMCAYRRGNMEAAKAAFRQAINLQPRDAVVYFQLGLMLLQDNKTEAARLFKLSLDKEPNGLYAPFSRYYLETKPQPEKKTASTGAGLRKSDPSGQFTITVPTGWSRLNADEKAISLTREDPALQLLRFGFLPQLDRTPQSLAQLAQFMMDKARQDPLLNNASVVEIKPTRIGKQDGFLVTFAFTTTEGLRFKRVIQGFPHESGVIFSLFQAPVLHYFARDYSTYLGIWASIKIKGATGDD